MIEIPGIPQPLSEALEQRGYSTLTPVQEAVLAPEYVSRDMLVSAQTGSGKTVAFGLAVAPTLLGEDARFGQADAPLALVVTPTRELAIQVKRELEWLFANAGARIASCVGGMDMRTERRALGAGAHIVVGTPGRLRDHISRNSLILDDIRAVVLDEADEMLDLGFREDLEFILEAAPVERRTLLFSATVSKPIAALAKRFQNDAARVSTTSDRDQHGDIEYRALTVAARDRENAIINVLRYYEAKNVLIFCGTRAAVNHLTSRFNNRGFSVVALSGELSQAQRTHALQAMRDGRAQVCIATDVAARGIDLPNLELVIHADIPKNRESLLHRSGRTGRAGRKGTSVLIVPNSARSRTDRLLRNAGVSAEWGNPPSAEEVLARDDERLLNHAVLADDAVEVDADLVQKLLEQNGPEKIAAAFVRLAREGKSAPEELEATSAAGQGKRKHSDFDNGPWISLSVGRTQGADPKWLLPLLVGAGNLNRRDVGAIRMQHNETFVQLAPGSDDGFFSALGPDAILERDITARRVEGIPAFAKAAQDHRKSSDGPRKPRPGKNRPGADERAPAKGAVTGLKKRKKVKGKTGAGKTS
ncbi:DEAD/DEAH box helicase [Amaricoccus tamworthensis]|uniref:DEAD/DEAH box helicase n=1 Tax=Amaricoccus tamworthensis TaxID=57002 RepID=UPI003C7CE1FA